MAIASYCTAFKSFLCLVALVFFGLYVSFPTSSPNLALKGDVNTAPG